MRISGNATGRGGLARPMLAVAVATVLAASLAACGGGGGNTRPDPPPPPATPPAPEPPPTPQPAVDAHLQLVDATANQRQGYTGAGYRIGVIDSGINRNHPALAGRVAANLVYVNPARNDMSVDDKVGHGTTVAMLAAGQPFGAWPGGVAPGATLLSARIINDERPQDDGSGQGNEVTGAIGVKAIHQDLAALGMRIMNNSWGGLYWTRPTVTAAIADEYRFFIRDYDGLVVFSTGNESRADPTDMASLPSQAGPNNSRPAADLERGWLAVAALDTASPDRLAWYSNACGIARNYCLVAPGTAVFPGHDATAANPSYYYGSGTSYAAPLVSGAAALVWEAFPYFDNDLVRQTLLGTATDLGEPGVDAVFGYGLLNVEKALRGPARFDWGDVTVSFDGSSAWTNPITGSGGLVKRGSGTLTLGAPGVELDYTGATRIEGGTLHVLGELTRSDVTVAAGGRLDGARRLGGNLVNEGVVHIGESAADGLGLGVGGDYVQRPGSQLSLVLGWGHLEVAGRATLQGGEVHVAGLRDGYVAEVREDVLRAEGGVTGRFDGLTAAPGLFLDASLLYGNHEVWLDVRRAEVTAAAAGLAGITPAALEAAQRVEAAFDLIDGGRSPDADGFLDAGGRLQRITDPRIAAAALRSLSGEVHGAAMAATYDTLDLTRRTLSSRFAGLAGGEGAGAWLRGLDGATAAGATQARLGGWMAGRDVAVDGLVVGMAFGETRSDSRLDGTADHSRERQTQVQAYLGASRGAAYAFGQIGGGQYRRWIDRQLLLGDRHHGLRSDYAGDFAVTSVEAGYRFGDGAAVLVPYAGAEHARVRSDAFAEAGAAGFGLRSGREGSARTQAIAGLRGRRDWGALRLSGYVEWQQTLASHGLRRPASFTGIEVWSPLAAEDPARSGGVFGLSARAWLSPHALLSLDWDRRFGPRGGADALSLRYSVGF